MNLGPRVSVTGEPLPPQRAATAAAQAGGWVTQEHIEALESFFTRCPVWVDTARRERFEGKLVAVAASSPPESLRQTINEACIC
ncbi:hypothetical protein M2272_000054 [Mycobacterium frederiksbergense]|uniref:DUF222 domain-containing protein n=1 Tax=Mycolicibacterium frederiksbergense TaxID=117567 RepID=A0ABT6KRS4_9MYCO|nr:DUF222 domain-containing protein [Mycolicibacterium frederiksbergense]MDH6193433.1 hypothetical protein [Mycolicibacterium frederiksbergense]